MKRSGGGSTEARKEEKRRGEGREWWTEGVAVGGRSGERGGG